MFDFIESLQSCLIYYSSEKTESKLIYENLEINIYFLIS